MSKKVAVLQSNYIPWKGYFDIIGSVDEFIFYDDLQYTNRDWRSRNKIKTDNGTIWLTIPCGKGGIESGRLICEVELPQNGWQEKHWRTICQYYKKAKCFSQFKDFFEEIYLGKTHTNLSEFNHSIIKKISTEIFGFKTKFLDSRDFDLHGVKKERLLELVKKSGATEYLSGPAAKNYVSEKDFDDIGIRLEWMDYSGYPEYPQAFPPFIHEVSVIDLIFNCGYDAVKYLEKTK